MTLNQAQLLVHDGEALAQFRADHRIPDDVVIERSGPNDDADWVEGEGNRIPIRTWFIYQAELRFSLSKLLRTILSLCGLTFMQISSSLGRTPRPRCSKVSDQWEFSAGEPDPFSVPRHRGYVPVGFNGRFWRRSDQCSAAISIVNNCRRSRKVSDLLGPRPRSSLSDEVSNLFEGTSAELRRLLEEAEGESSDSSESSSSSWDVDLGDEDLDEEAEVEDGKEVDQVPAAAPLVPIPLVPFPDPIILPSSDSDIAGVEPREVVEHSYSRSDSSSSGSQGNEETMAPKVRILGKRQAPRTKPARLPEVPDSSVLDHETCIALGNAMMLPQDVADHAAETTVEFGGKLVMLGAQRVVSTSLWLKQGAVDLKKENQKENSLKKELKQTKSELADVRSAAEIGTLQRNQAQQETSDVKAFACDEVYKKLFDRAFERAGDVYERQLAELCPGVFQEGWLACLKELKTLLDHPAWASPAPPIQLPASPERYSPIILLDFNEEEYATLPADEGNVNTVVAEARVGIEGTVDGDRAEEIEGDRAGEAEDRCSARGGLVELASPSLSTFVEYPSLVGTLPYLKATIHKAVALLAVLDDRSVVPLSFRMEG
ncbi:hypothetical protein Acr_24g0005930 [Actinidia rufa]|uniref:Uncharacterized protein n=1 Tax=Actinidia rufa TaxID=165716 RepID=A0A7J0GUD9_9ERIC|nr:hypothetical protein Acr_24g0005930 [Actinidia rufa]